MKSVRGVSFQPSDSVKCVAGELQATQAASLWWITMGMAGKKKLNPKYVSVMWSMQHTGQPSNLLSPIKPSIVLEMQITIPVGKAIEFTVDK